MLNMCEMVKSKTICPFFISHLCQYCQYDPCQYDPPPHHPCHYDPCQCDWTKGLATSSEDPVKAAKVQTSHDYDHDDYDGDGDKWSIVVMYISFELGISSEWPDNNQSGFEFLKFNFILKIIIIIHHHHPPSSSTIIIHRHHQYHHHRCRHHQYHVSLDLYKEQPSSETGLRSIFLFCLDCLFFRQTDRIIIKSLSFHIESISIIIWKSYDVIQRAIILLRIDTNSAFTSSISDSDMIISKSKPFQKLLQTSCWIVSLLLPLEPIKEARITFITARSS